MKTKKFLALILAMLMIALSFAACANNPAKTDDETTEPESVSFASPLKTVNVSVLKGPTGMASAYMWSQSDKGETTGKYNFTLDADATAVGPKLMTGEYDIASIPTNMAAALYNKSQGKVKVIAVNTLGVLYILSKDASVTSLADLNGKTILASGQGTVAEYALKYVLDGNKINANVEFTAEHSETVTKAMAGEADIVLLPEPFVTQLTKKNADFKVAVNITKEWEALGDTILAMGCIAVNADFYENNKAEVEAFIKDFKASADYTNANTDAAAALIEEHDIMAAVVAASAIPNCNIVCYTGETMKSTLSSFYNVLLNQDAKTIGGAFPADDFFINAEG